jgi:hypothetical protein
MPAGRLHLINTLVLASLIAPATAQILTTQPPPLSTWDFSGVRPVADEIQTAADRARLAASQQTRPDQREHAAALSALTTLSMAAQHFSTRIDQFRHDPEPTRQDYLGLVRSYKQAQQSVMNIGYDANVIRDFNRIEALLDRLSLIYTQRWDRDRARAAADVLDASLTNALQIARQRAQDQPADQRAVFLLNRLAQGAGFLHRQLDRQQDPLVTGQDFQMLLADYSLTMRSLEPASFEQYLETDLNRAGQALAQLRQAYQVQWNSSNARSVADQIRVSAQRVLGAMAEQARRGGEGESRTLDHLRLLAETADRLARQLEVRPEVPLYTYPDFLTLAAAYSDSSFDLAPASVGPQVIAEMNGIGQRVTQLNRMYSGALEQGPARLTGTVTGK